LSDVMKAQYTILAELRRIDEKVARLQLDVERIPQEMGKLEQALGAKRDEFNKTKHTVDENEKKLRKAEQDLKAREDLLTKAQGKMMEVKTNEEYQAAMKENASQKEAKGGFEETVLKLLNDVEDQKTKLKESETVFKTYESTIQADVKRLEDERSRMLKLLEEQITLRSGMASQLSPDVHSLYARVANRIKGVAVVFVENGSCMGCHMKMRPQLYNEILGFKTIHRCPSCGRILILAPKDTDTADAEAATK
jgi:predicted  nucleic acid-binding Zn-ribbon protein